MTCFVVGGEFWNDAASFRASSLHLSQRFHQQQKRCSNLGNWRIDSLCSLVKKKCCIETGHSACLCSSGGVIGSNRSVSPSLGFLDLHFGFDHRNHLRRNIDAFGFQGG